MFSAFAEGIDALLVPRFSVEAILNLDPPSLFCLNVSCCAGLMHKQWHGERFIGVEAEAFIPIVVCRAVIKQPVVGGAGSDSYSQEYKWVLTEGGLY